MKIAIVDDEPMWIGRAEERIRAFYGFPVEIMTYSSGNAFLEQDLQMETEGKTPFDIVFLDVEMKGLDGFETTIQFKNRHKDTPVILLTAHGEYSRRGYRVKAFRYLEKQYLDEIDEALESIGIINPEDKWIILPLADGSERQVRTMDICYAEVWSHGTSVALEREKFYCALPLLRLAKLLEEENFYRCHQGFLVNLKYVEDVDDLDAIMQSGERIPVSRRHLREMKSRFVTYHYERASR